MDDECSPGLEGCPCADGLCIVGLACLSDLCVDPGDLTTGDGETSSGEGGTTGAGGDGGWMPCIANDECSAWEICNYDGVCDAARKYDYLVTVSSFSPPDCSDGWGSADVVFDIYLDGVFSMRSSEAFCPAAWPDDTFVINGSESFQIDFLEADAFSDDAFTSVCWQDAYGKCRDIPPEHLHNEGFDGLTGDGIYTFSLDFQLVP